MIQYPDTLITTEWLMPNLQEKLSSLHQRWRQADGQTDFAALAADYLSLSGTLQVASLPVFAQFSLSIAAMAKALAADLLETSYMYMALSSSELLLHEMHNYVQTGTYHHSLLHQHYDYVIQLLKAHDFELVDGRALALNWKDVPNINRHNQDASYGEQLALSLQQQIAPESEKAEGNVDVFRGLAHYISLPSLVELDNTEALNDQQWTFLITAWRFTVAKLLSQAKNDPSTLQQLQQIIAYCLNHALSVQDELAAKLWYLADLWFAELQSNEQPLPASYAYILDNIDVLIVEASQSEPHSALQLNSLILDIYIHLKNLNISQQLVQDVLHQVELGLQQNSVFFTRLLEQLEQLIYEFGQPQAAVAVLQELDRQLLQRGWDIFHEQFVQLIDDVSSCINDEQKMSQIQWQIESQLQQLYSDIFNTYQTLDDKVAVPPHSGDSSESKTADTVEPLVTSVDVIENIEALDKVKSSIEQIKQGFNDYLQLHDVEQLPTKQQFLSIDETFAEIDLPDVVQTMQQYQQLFLSLRQHDISHITWDITDAMTESLAALELFLGCLSQQFYHAGLLKIIQTNTESARHLLDELIATGLDIEPQKLAQISSTQASTNDTLRYDDSGEVHPASLDKQADAANLQRDATLDKVDSDTNKKSAPEVEPQQDVSDTSTAKQVDASRVVKVAKVRKAGKTVLQASDVETAAEDQVPAHSTDSQLQQPPATYSDALKVVRSQLADDAFDLDQEIRDVFIEEAQEVVATLDKYLPEWERQPQDTDALTVICRSFHTLKSSGRMVGAHGIGELAWAVEQVLRQIAEGDLVANATIFDFVTKVKQLLPVFMSDFAAKQAPSIDPAIFILQAQNLRSDLPINQGIDADTLASISPSIDASSNIQAPKDHKTSVVSNDKAGDEVAATAIATLASAHLPERLSSHLAGLQVPEDDASMNEDMKEIFIEEAEEVLETISPLYRQWQKQPDDWSNLVEVRRGFHTLKGSGRMVGANRTAELAWAVENMLNRVLDHSIDINADIEQLVADVLAAYPDLLASYEKQLDYSENLPLWIACAELYSKADAADFSYIQVKQQLLDASDDTVLSSAQAKQDESSQHQAAADVGLTEEVLLSLKTANEKLAEVAETEDLSLENSQINEIFLEEAFELVDYIERFIADNKNQQEVAVTDEFVRAFHTLRGASGSISLQAISDISATVEQSLKSLQQYDESMNAKHLQAIKQSVQLIKKYIVDFKETSGEVSEQQPTIAIDSKDNYQEVEALQVMFNELTETEKSHEAPFSVADILSHEIDELLDAEWELEGYLAQADHTQRSQYAQTIVQQIDKMSAQVSGSKKFTTLLSALQAVYQRVADDPAQAEDESLISALLAGQTQLTGLLDSIAGSMALRLDETVIQQLQQFAPMAATAEVADADTSSDHSDQIVHQDTAADSTASSLKQNLAEKELQFEPVSSDSELLDIFLEEAQEIDAQIHQSFAEWKQTPNNIEPLKALQRQLHTLKGGARMVAISSMSDLTHEAESIYEQFVAGSLSPSAAWVDVMQDVQDILSLQLDYVINHKKSFFLPEMVEQLHALLNKTQDPEDFQVSLPTLDVEKESDAEVTVATETVSQPEEPVAAELAEQNLSAAAQQFYQLVSDSWEDTPPDDETKTIFLEETNSLIEHNKQALQSFKDSIKDINVFGSMQRNYHTIKGGARMIASLGIGELAYQLEKTSEGLYNRNLPPKKIVIELIAACHQWLDEALQLLTRNVNPPEPSELIIGLQQFNVDPDILVEVPEQSLQAYIDIVESYEEEQRSKMPSHDISHVPAMTGNFVQTQDKDALNNEMVRISSGLIERMINLSGEAAINRARIDMGVSSLTNTIEEMGVTVQRLADQLRRMETELEAQILSQIDEKDLLDNAGFDPLEMDQYSSLNQLSKSLSESASDLLDIKTTMLDKTRDAESLLLQLSRTQTELQDNLMNSRMVPFSRVVPRLQRIVRQTANELDKSVHLTVINAEDEIDRTILERITSPLEHMIRNAVDHGIEVPEVRKQKGKDATGNVVIEVLREGNEIVINLSDDGRGIDVEKVRQKAIDKGMIASDDHTLSDLDVIQYVFNAGLTTSSQVTQISGRGVGMDIVQTEVRQLGGNVAVELVEGGGTRFSMRVPLTVAISDALVVRVADRYYAIPLVQIDRVVRINPEAILDFYRSDETHFEIDGSSYRLRYLNELLLGSALNQMSVTNQTSLPVILVKSRSGQNIAIQVDEISGSRIEVVVKSLGRQLSHASGVSSATIMGDGSVMLILDLIALMRNSSTRAAAMKAALTNKFAKSRSTILVVDDSVTVRKVTSRLLERQGYDVQVAKDGIDAIEILQDLTPDLMLLDIEMPRMDGFEVATQVRHDAKLKNMPIIMITSRTGDKHRQRALEIGVNDYMGKPYQEAQLINKIQSLLGQGE